MPDQIISNGTVNTQNVESPLISNMNSSQDNPPVSQSETRSPPLIQTFSAKKFAGKKIIATILGIIFLIGGTVVGVRLVQQNQETREKAAGGLSANSTISHDPIDPDGEKRYYINSSVEYQANSNNHIKIHKAWINHQGDNAGKERGLFSWAASASDLTGSPISCECGNQGQCALGGGYAVLESGLEYVDLVRCTAWSNTITDNGHANHAVLFFFKAQPKWGIDGPLTLNDISTYGVNVNNQTLNWVNSDLNFRVIGPNISASCLNIKAYSTNNNWITWNQLNLTDLAKLQPGKKIRFTVSGTKTGGSFDKAHFRINSSTWGNDVTQKKPGTEEFYSNDFTIPTGTLTFTVNAQIHHDTLGWF